MCKARSEGGRRCASHTREKFFNAFASDGQRYDDAAAEYAATGEGRAHIEEIIREAGDNLPPELEARLHNAMKKGEAIREATSETEAIIQAQKDAHTSRESLKSTSMADLNCMQADIHHEMANRKMRRRFDGMADRHPKVSSFTYLLTDTADDRATGRVESISYRDGTSVTRRDMTSGQRLDMVGIETELGTLTSAEAREYFYRHPQIAGTEDISVEGDDEVPGKNLTINHRLDDPLDERHPGDDPQDWVY